MVCIYFLFAVFRGGGALRQTGSPASMSVEEKAAVRDAVAQSSGGDTGHTTAEVKARMRTIENVTQSSSTSPAAQQSDADKLNVLNSLSPQ